MLNNYESVYHLHIPRTSGIFIKNHMLHEFKDKNIFATHYKDINLTEIENCYFVSGHFGTTPLRYMKNPLLFSILRNPVDRYISYIKYTRDFFNNMTEKELLNMWLYDENFYNKHINSQIKFILNQIDLSKYNGSSIRDKVINNWFIVSNNTDIQMAKYIVDNNHIFTMNNIESLTQNICQILKVNDFRHYSKINESDKFNIKLNKIQYDRIEHINALDMELYDYARKKE